jgi:hypothetical protein
LPEAFRCVKAPSSANNFHQENRMTDNMNPNRGSDKNDEPEITQEDSIPSDGKDVEGEELMKKVGNAELDQQPGEEKSE